MAVLFPDFSVNVTRIEQTIGVQDEPPVFWHSAAPQWEQENATYVDGHYIPPTGEATGKQIIVFNDTTIQGTGGRTSPRSFDAVAGTWFTDGVLPDYNVYGISCFDTTAGATFEALEHSVHSSSGITHQQLVIRRSIKPAAATNPEDIYTYIELANGDKNNYRISLPWNDCPSLDYFDTLTGLWRTGVCVLTEITNCGEYFRANHNEMRIKVVPDNIRNIMLIEVGHGNWFRHAPDRNVPTAKGYVTGINPNITNLLPQNERLRVYGKNGWVEFWTLPIEYKPLVINKSSKKVPAVGDINQAQVSINGMGRDDPNSTVKFTADIDDNNNLSYSSTITPTDNTKPPTASDIFFYIPSSYSTPILGGIPPPGVNPPIIRVETSEIFDDITRFVSRSAKIIIDNQSGAYTGSYGNFHATLDTSNGTTYGRELTGLMVGGFTAYGPAGAHLVEANLRDYSYILTKAAIRQEVAFDRWCYFGAIHGMLDLAQIPPQLRKNIPYWPPGPASYDCPYPILPAGLGNNPMLRYYPDARGIQPFLDLLQDGFPDHVTGANVPLIGGTTPNGQWFVDTYDPRRLPVVAAYTDDDQVYGGLYGIQDIVVYNTIDDMRTDLDFQGQDPYTGEMIYYHLPLTWNLYTVGFHDGWFERQGRWCSPAYLERIAKSAAVMASLATQNVVITVPYDPNIHVGQVVSIYERSKLGRGGTFVVLQKHGRLGMVDVLGRTGEQDCTMSLVCRAAENLTPY